MLESTSDRATKSRGACSPGPTVAAEVPAGEHAPRDFVALSDVDSSILQDIRYAGAHNFVGRPIAGYREPVCLLTRPAAQALSRVQTAARARGYSVKVYDCYRPESAGEDFSRWARDPEDDAMKAEFYPSTPKSELFRRGYVGGGRTSHTRGSTVDLTLVKLPPRAQPEFVPGQPLVSCTAPVSKRFPDNTIDMGTGFDCFESQAHTLDPRITGTPRSNRLLLKQLMEAEGFANYANEWWHYRYLAEPYTDRYFDFPVANAAVS